jgi:hypothetical protein
METRKLARVLTAKWILGSWLFASPVCGGAQSATDLAYSLTHESSHASPVFTCGSLGTDFEGKRDEARSLVALGDAALPAVDGALDSMSKVDAGPRIGVGWLLLAYAEIKGPAAFPRLRRMIDDPRLDSLHPRLDSALAVALGLTSYVGGTVAPRMTGICERPEPRAILDHLVFALNRDDPSMLGESLGPNARATFDAMLKDGGWSQLRLSPGHGSPTWGGAAVGYRFEIAGRWSRPDQTLDPSEPDHFYGSGEPLNPEINAVFVNRYGGRSFLRFLARPSQAAVPSVDSEAALLADWG